MHDSIKRIRHQRDDIKYISSKSFFIHDLDKCDEIDVHQICSKDNLANLFTKTPSTTIFERLQYSIEMQ